MNEPLSSTSQPETPDIPDLPLLTMRQLARVLGMTVYAVRARADRGSLFGLPVVQEAGEGGRRYVRSADVRRLIRGGV